nr:hypothetical protein [Pseudomonas putida]
MNRIYPCTAADPMGLGGQDGLLGQGDLPWPSVVAARTYAKMDVGGLYSADDMSAAEFLVAELQSSETQLSADEAEEYAQLLYSLIAKMEKSGRFAADELLAIKEKAEKIPVVGALLFSTANLPGTLANVAALGHAASKATKVENLLNMTDATRGKLKKWAASRGKPGSVSAARAMKGRLKLVRMGGNLYFEIPANSQASLYRLPGRGSNLHVAAFNTAKAMRATAHIDSAGYSSRGVGKVLTGAKLGGALAFGPQAYLDATEAKSVSEFLQKSAYTQPTNALAFGVGVLVGGLTGPAIVVIALSLGAGLAVQFVMSDDFSGLGTTLGNFLTGKD